jgi:hypothetical protein
MKIIKLNEGDLIRIIKKMIHEQSNNNPNDGDMDPTSLKALTDHINKVLQSLLDDIQYVKKEMRDVTTSNLTDKDKEYLTGLWNRVLEVIHMDTSPPIQEEPDDQDNY